VEMTLTLSPPGRALRRGVRDSRLAHLLPKEDQRHHVARFRGYLLHFQERRHRLRSRCVLSPSLILRPSRADPSPSTRAEMSGFLDNCVNFGGDVLATNGEYRKMLLDFYDTVMTSRNLGAEDRCVACKLGEAMLLSLRGNIDEVRLAL
jgi:hypothetical protein